VKNLVLELTSKNAPFSEPLGAPKIKWRVYYSCRHFIQENGCKQNHSFGLAPDKGHKQVCSEYIFLPGGTLLRA